MDMIDLFVGLMSGVVGGNLVGEALKNQSFGTTGNSFFGMLGGAIAAAILQSLGAAARSGTDVLDAASLIAIITSCGVGGALVMIVIGLIKSTLAKAGSA